MTKGLEWTPAIIDRLTSLYREKLSYKYIAELMTKEFQHSFSRSCISGKLHRLELERREPKPIVRKARKRKVKAPPAAPPDPPAVKYVYRDKPTFLELEYGYCKWPSEGPPPYTFCGTPVGEAGDPYCSHHKTIAYYKPRKTWT